MKQRLSEGVGELDGEMKVDRMAGGEVGVEAVRIESDGGSVKREQSRVTRR